jgi:putative transposase
LIVAAEELAGRIGQTAQACEALGVARSTLYRRRRPVTSKPKRRPRPHRALDENEREGVLDALHSERFVDKAPAQVWATLLDEGIYLCSIRTMYRILHAYDEVRERRNQRRHPNYAKPELLAEAPNQVWSWDITKLRGPVKWSYYYLYVILDIFSRYVVGWMLAQRESAALAKRLIAESCRKQNIEPDQLTMHADRGSSMRSKSVAFLLADLGVTKTHSRPYVSNDNPYSESQFKTLKYCPQFPSRFGSIQDARLFCCGFFDYYNHDHRHSGIGLMTPADVHYGRAEQLTTARRQILLEAHRTHPERFVRGTPQPPVLPLQAWINPPPEKTTLQDAAGANLSTGSIPQVLPFSASPNEISIEADGGTDVTRLSKTIIETH